MELLFAKRLREYRLKMDMTQEAMAKAVGISPQSVSKWERGDGYPDITLLPKIARVCGVTIDTLLGNDAETVETDIRGFIDRVRGDMEEDERLALGLEYAGKYPDCDRVLHEVCWILMWLPEEKREAHLPLLWEMCEKIMSISTEQTYRDAALEMLCRTCPDDQFEKWHGMCAHMYDAYEGEVLEKRLKSKNDFTGYLAQYDANNLRIMMHLLSHMDERTSKTSDRGVKQMKFRIRILEALAEDGVVPDAWLGEYAHCHICLACRYFADGDSDEGYFHAETALDAAEKWWGIPDCEYMETGDTEIFGGCSVLRNEWILRRGNGELEDASHDYLCFLGERESMHVILTNWPGFEPVCGEERFQTLVQRAKAMPEA